MRILADLHMHSYYSDGIFSPAAVARFGLQAGCAVLSLTDHDTTAGVAEMTAECNELGIVNIAGIEISAHGKVETHILGYGIDILNNQFCSYIDMLEHTRQQRSYKLIEKLKQHNIVFPENYIESRAKRGISRTHIAEAMADLKMEISSEQAFKKWLREGAAAYVPMERRDLKEAINIIKIAGGISVLAHPMRLRMDRFERIEFIKQLKDFGLDGIEAVYKTSSAATIREYRQIADRYNLLVSCGGDFHNQNNEIMARVIPPAIAKKLNIQI